MTSTSPVYCPVCGELNNGVACDAPGCGLAAIPPPKPKDPPTLPPVTLAGDLHAETYVYTAAEVQDFLEDCLDLAKADDSSELKAENERLRAALVSFTKSSYIKQQHPRRYAAALKALKK